MSAKQTTIEQHEALHLSWPSDCCLCKLEAENKMLREAIDAVPEWVDSPRGIGDYITWCPVCKNDEEQGHKEGCVKDEN